MDLSSEDQEKFDEWAKHQRETNIKNMAESAAVMSIYPRSSEFDIDFALQLGAAILMGKPILIMVSPGQEIPGKLRQFADRVVEVSQDDIDTGGGSLRDAVMSFIAEKVVPE